MIHFVHLFSGLCPLLVGLVTILGFAATTKEDLTQPRKPVTVGALIVAALMGFALMFSGLIVLFL